MLFCCYCRLLHLKAKSKEFKRSRLKTATLLGMPSECENFKCPFHYSFAKFKLVLIKGVNISNRTCNSAFSEGEMFDLKKTYQYFMLHSNMLLLYPNLCALEFKLDNFNLQMTVASIWYNEIGSSVLVETCQATKFRNNVGLIFIGQLKIIVCVRFIKYQKYQWPFI